MELADQQNLEAEGAVAGAEIPVSPGETASPSASPATEKPLSVRDQITKSIETVRTEEAKRARDTATGKFTKPEASAEKPAAAAEIQPEKKEAQPEPASKPFAPPPGFSTETKAFLATLPEDHPIKRDLAKREGEVSNGIKTYSDKAKNYDAIDQIIAPVRSTFQQAGISSDADAIKVLLGWEAGFRNPATRQQAFLNLAQQYGFDISTLVPSSQSGSPSAAQQDIPDQLRPVIDQFGNVAQQVQSVEARLQNWENTQVAERLSAFAGSHPHFEAVRVQMGQLMSAGIVPPGDLEKAYQKAIALNDEVSAQIKAEDDRKKSEELARANAEKVRKAALAAVSPSTRPPSGAPSAQTGKKANVRESILSSINALREEQRA
jgi:hypothetical protein